MSVPADHNDSMVGVVPQSTGTANWAITVSDIKTVLVSNISLAVSKRDIQEFFSFSGDIQYIEMLRESEKTQLAYVTFKELQGADTAMLLTGATIADLSVTIKPAENYQLPPEAFPLEKDIKPASTGSTAVKKAEEVVSTMLAKGFSLGKDAVNKAKTFDEKIHLTSTTTSTISSIDRKVGLTDKLREIDDRFNVSQNTKSLYFAAEQKASSAGSVIMGNHYVSIGASWVSSALSAVAKAAEDVSVMTKEKVEMAEEEKKAIEFREKAALVNDFAKIHLDEEFEVNEPPVVVSISSDHDNKLNNI